jgi:hypothetical protein
MKFLAPTTIAIFLGAPQCLGALSNLHGDLENGALIHTGCMIRQLTVRSAHSETKHRTAYSSKRVPNGQTYLRPRSPA